MTDEVKKVLLGEELTVDEYLTLDDSVILFHFNMWSKSQDNILCDLSSRFMSRNLFKATELRKDKYDTGELVEKYNSILKVLNKAGFDSKYYLPEDKAEHSTYIDYYLFSKKAKDGEASEDIYLFDEKGGYLELCEESDLIKAVRNTTKVFDRLYYPKEVREDVNEILLKRG